MNSITIVMLLFAHFMADFLLQTREMGKKKSTEVKWLLAHVAIIWVVFFFFGCFLSGSNYVQSNVLLFTTLNAFAHLIIDGTTWNIYKWSLDGRHVDWWEDKWFYVTIGADQFLHVAVLIVLIEKLLK